MSFCSPRRQATIHLPSRVYTEVVSCPVLSRSLPRRYVAEKLQERKYAFKCHRSKVDGIDTVYPVNSIAFHPVHGTFATGGADGSVHVWDGERKKRVCSLRRYPSSIASLSFSPSGEHLAIAASYAYENGTESGRTPNAIFVRRCDPSDVRPKAPKPKV